MAVPVLASIVIFLLYIPVQGFDSDVWDYEVIRSPLPAGMVAGPIQRCLQNIQQHEAAWTASWGTYNYTNNCKLWLYTVMEFLCSKYNLLFLASYGRLWENLLLTFCCLLSCRRLSGWRPRATTPSMPWWMSSLSTLRFLLLCYWTIFYPSYCGVSSRVRI